MHAVDLSHFYSPSGSIVWQRSAVS